MRCGHRAHHQPAEPAGTGGGRPGRRRGKAPGKGAFPLRGGAPLPGRGPLRRGGGGLLFHPLACCREAYEIEDHVAALLSATRHTQGVFCLCRWPQGLAGGELPLDGGPCLVLEQLQDPGNLGTVLRTAEALGVGQVYLLGDCCDPLSPKALRASMGAAFRVRLAVEASPQRLCGLLRERGYRLHAAVPHRDAAPITTIDFAAGAHAVFVGNEGAGLREETIALCEDRVTIPMAGRAESLNASAAATILLWEMTRGGVRHG